MCEYGGPRTKKDCFGFMPVVGYTVAGIILHHQFRDIRTRHIPGTGGVLVYCSDLVIIIDKWPMRILKGMGRGILSLCFHVKRGQVRIQYGKDIIYTGDPDCDFFLHISFRNHTQSDNYGGHNYCRNNN